MQNSMKPMVDVWGSGAHDIYFSGDFSYWNPGSSTGGFPLELHYDGATWHAVATFRYWWETNQVNAFATHPSCDWDVDDSYGVGALGCSFRLSYYDGAVWSEVYSDWRMPEQKLLGVWGSSGQDIYMLDRGGVVHYPGFPGADTPTPTATPSATPTATPTPTITPRPRQMRYLPLVLR